MDYKSLKEKLDSKKSFPESKYKKIRKRLEKGEGNTLGLYNTERKIEDYFKYGTKKVPHLIKNRDVRHKLKMRENAQEHIASISKKDIETLILFKLNKLSGNASYYREVSGKRNAMGNIMDISYLKSDIRDIERILSHKKLLNEKGISNLEIEKYNGALKKRVERELKKGIEYSNSPQEVKSIGKVLEYAKKHNLISSKTGGLEKSLAIISSCFLIACIFFLSNNFTGNTIGNLTKTSSNITGAILFVLGIIGLFAFTKNN